MTYGTELGVLSLVRVVIQTDKIKSRLHLIAAPPEHVIPADTLTAHLVTPVGRQEVKEGEAGRKNPAEPGTQRGTQSPGNQLEVFTPLHTDTSDKRNSLVVDGPAQIAVTWSAAVHVVAQTPVFILGERKQMTCVRKSFSGGKDAFHSFRSYPRAPVRANDLGG